MQSYKKKKDDQLYPGFQFHHLLTYTTVINIKTKLNFAVVVFFSIIAGSISF